MYELLLQLPLFQGVSAETLSTLVEKYRFHFLKCREGDTVVEAGDVCTHVRFVVSGAVRLTTRCRHLDVSLSQTLAAPNVLGPDSLFGVDTTYSFTAVAVDNCGVLQIAKADYVAMLQADKVLLFNILNYLSRGMQVFASFTLGVRDGGAAEALLRWVKPLTSRTSQEVVIRYTQKDLCTLLGVRRKALLESLADLQNAGWVSLDHRQISIHDLRHFASQIEILNANETD
ncbi:MAG: Crp/Fnr family transcriptional regulator [Muribaculaceae bacterium]|nr:Crp/Fnr family transcriptional regulator [Muribaculaceae bacterium]